MSGRPANGCDYVNGVAVFGDGVVVFGDGSLDWPPPDPDEPSDPPEPLSPASGHGWPSCPWRVPRDESVDPPEDGSLLAPGAALGDGSGLAAATIATPPVTNNAAAMPAVRTARRNPFGLPVTAGPGVGLGRGGAVSASTR